MIETATAINSFASTATRAEFVPIFRTALELAQDDPDFGLHEEKQHLNDPKKFFELLEQISVGILAPILEHEATDKESRALARDLKSLPDYLQSYLAREMMSYPDAIEELIPKLIEGKDKLLQKKKPQAAETKEEHRAKLLIEKLESLELISVSQAIKIIHTDEGKAPNHSMTRRAMKKAAEISLNAVFLNGWNDGLGSVLRWKEEGAENYAAWYT